VQLFQILSVRAIRIVQILIEQASGRLRTVVAHIRSLLFDWAWGIHKVRTQLVAPQAFPTGNPTLMSLPLMTYIPPSASIPIFTSVRLGIQVRFPVPDLVIAVLSDFFRNCIRGASNDFGDLLKSSVFPQSLLNLITVFPG
jgi:hypothetical protein